MIILPGYEPFEQIYSGIRTSVYRAIRKSDSKPVVIKILRHEYPTFSELVQFRNQYTIAKNLDLPGVIKTYNLEPYKNRYALIMEDYGGISLKNWSIRNLETQNLTELPDFFDIAIQVVTSLDGLYRNRVIHKDIKPANILINPTTKQVKLIDFSIASKLPKETQTLQYCNFLEGTLSYISPEQTGRMNRLVDWRSDFYSLGVTLFELITGQLPFTSQDPMELVYSHLAKQPPLAHNINRDIPIILSNIVAKLMAKNAEDRYQSALGLKYDLEQASLMCQELQNVDKCFELGQRDISDRFAIPEKLYGREAEVKTLLAAFERVANPQASRSPGRAKAVEMVMVAGFSGIGKTAVVNEVHKPIVRQRSYFIKGKYDQFQRNVPFSGFLQAFRDLMEQLSRESDVQLNHWKTQILAALGEQGQVIIEFIPELERIIGLQPACAKLSGSAAINRFNLCFVKFIQVFTREKHPLVIFIDDLQWADSASLNLMQSLVISDIKHLLLIGAYRDNEVSAAHPLLLTLEEIKKERVKINTIFLKPLSIDDLTHLVADTLNCSYDAAPLTNIIYQKTQGNPFFSSQFFKSLYEDGLIKFNRDEYYLNKSSGWECNLSQIKELAFTDVVEFLAAQLQKLPEATQSILKLAACIGNQFDLSSLAIVNNKSQAATAADLWKALEEGLIIPTNEIYKLFQENLTDNELSLVNKHQSVISYKFIHDRVQQAAYSLIPEDQKQITHLNIGQLLLSHTPINKEERIFDIVNQLNYGVNLINTPEQLLELAQLNLVAGRKAKASTANIAATQYFDVALEILSDYGWNPLNPDYELVLALHEEACDAAYLCGDFEKMEQFAEQVIKYGKTVLDKIRVYEIKIQAYIVQNRLIEALNICLDVLKLFNIEFPEAPKKSDIQQAFQTMAALLAGRNIADLINLPEMSNPEILAAMRILSSMFSAAYLGSPEFVPLITLKMVDLSIQYGNTGVSANGYCTYGFLLCCVMSDVDTGYKFAQLSLNVLSKTNIASLQAKTLLIYNALVGHWFRSAREFLKPLQEVYQIGLETGDLEFASYALHNYSFGSYLTGKELTALEEEMSVYSETLRKLKQKTGLSYIQIWRQTILNLINRSDDTCSLVGSVYDEQVMLPQHQKMNDITAICMVYFNKCTLNYLFGKSYTALEYAIQVEKYLNGLTGLLIYPAFYFYDSLVRLAVYVDVSYQSEILEKVHFNQEKMQHWANHAPMNFLHKYYLVEAERHRVLDDKLAAMDYYEQAITLAKENEYIQEEALANELAAKFYLGWNKIIIAQTYLINAYYCYARWGASAKVQDLEKRYPHLITPIQERNYNLNHETIATTNSINFTITGNTSTVSNSLDILSLVKASQAISSEIEIEKLLVSLMQVLIENAGASKAVLILPKSNKLVIEAIGLSTTVVTSLLESIPIEDSQEIPIHLVNYVARIKEHILFNNAAIEMRNYQDTYILQQKPQSLLCNPIVNQGKLVAILYLENNLAIGAFTESRLHFIKLLCSQIAISLENARLYQQSQDYGQKLESSLENLKQAQLKLIQSEKMTALGNLVAGIGHEINNPINFLANNLQPAREYVQELLTVLDLYKNYYPNPVTQIVEQLKSIDFDYIQEDLPKVIASMQQAVDRISEISISLRTFSRADTQKKVLFNIHEGIDSALMLLKHRLKASESRPDIEVVRNYNELPQINGYPGQLNQVFMNLLANAIDALEESNAGRSFNEIMQSPNRITVSTSLNDNKSHVVITIRDNGIGIKPEVKAKIFDHLFTTKDVGKGTGLGLTIVRQIVVEKHGGTIEVNSTIGEGTAFLISIPV